LLSGPCVNRKALGSPLQKGWLPKRNSPRRRRGQAEPQILCRVVRVDADAEATKDAHVEQTVEVTLGPKAVFKKGNVGRITRQVTADQLLPYAPRRCARRRRKAAEPKPPKKPRQSRAARFLRLAQEWQRQLDDGEIESQAAIARREGITRARVCQIMSLLRLAPEIQRKVHAAASGPPGQVLSERDLRPLTSMADHEEQIAALEEAMAVHV